MTQRKGENKIADIFFSVLYDVCNLKCWGNVLSYTLYVKTCIYKTKSQNRTIPEKLENFQDSSTNGLKEPVLSKIAIL